MTKCKPKPIEFHPLGSREVVAHFDGGDITSDGGGLILREVEQRTGSRERLFVRVLGRGADALFVSMPPGWSDFDIDRLGADDQGVERAPARSRDAVLEVASARLVDGTILQVGKSNEIRVNQVAGEHTTTESAFLGAFDIAERTIIEDDRHHVQAVLTRRRELAD